MTFETTAGTTNGYHYNGANSSSDGNTNGHAQNSRETKHVRRNYIRLGAETHRLATQCFASFQDKAVPKVGFLVWEISAFPQGKVSLLSGPGGIGKSSILVQLGIARDLGQKWLGMDVAPGRTLLISCEDDAHDLHGRAHRICQMYDAELEDLERFTFVDLVGQDTELVQYNFKNRRLEPTPLYNQIRLEIEATECDTLILDGASHMYAGNDLDKVQVRQFLDLLTRIARDYGIAVILLFHPSKSGIESGTGKGGTEAWHNLVRHRIYYAPQAPDGDENLRTLTVKKNNFGPAGQTITVRNDGGVFIREHADSERSREFEVDLLFLRLLDSHARQGFKYSPNRSNKYAPARLADTSEAKAARCNKDILTASMHRLLNERLIQIKESGPPSGRKQSLEVNLDNTRVLSLLRQANAQEKHHADE